MGKEVMIRPNVLAHASLQGKLIGSSGRALVILVKRLADTNTELHLSSEAIPGTIEPIDRDSLERQLERICNQKLGYLVNIDISKYVLHEPQIRGCMTIMSLASLSPYDSMDVLNVVQREAVTWARQLKGIGLLAGPPGTGKTQTAAELIFTLTKGSDQEGPILVVSSSNAAVDELLARAVQVKPRCDPEGQIVIGRLCSKTHGQIYRYSKVSEYDMASIVIRTRHCEQRNLDGTGHKSTGAAKETADTHALVDCNEFFTLMD